MLGRASGAGGAGGVAFILIVGVAFFLIRRDRRIMIRIR